MISSKLPVRGPPWLGPVVIARVSQVTGNPWGEQVRLSLSRSSSATRRSWLYICLIYLGRVHRRHGALLKNPARAESQDAHADTHVHTHAHTVNRHAAHSCAENSPWLIEAALICLLREWMCHRLLVSRQFPLDYASLCQGTQTAGKSELQ